MTDSIEPASLPSVAETTSMLRAAIGQIRFARQYTLELLDATPQELWFQIPTGFFYQHRLAGRASRGQPVRVADVSYSRPPTGRSGIDTR